MKKILHSINYPKWMAAFFLSCVFASGLMAQTITIGTGTLTTNGSTADPIERYYNYEHFQMVWTASELTAAGLPSGASITGMGFSVSESASALANFTISMGHTSQASASPGVNPATLTTVKTAFTYNPVVQTAGNFDMITFTTPFVWNGTSNIIVNTCTGSNPFTSPYGGLRYTTGATVTYTRTDGSSNCAGTPASTTTNRPNVRFSYTGGAACTGTPAPGNTLSTATSVCSGVNFTLSLQNATLGTGVTYQWQSADDNGFTVNLANLGTASTQVTSTTTNKYYRCLVTCAGSTTPSNPVPITVISGACQCAAYCNSAFTNVTYEYVTNVNFAGINNTSVGVIGGPVNFLNQSGNVTIGNTYPLSVTIDPDALDYVYAWIDWDQNGVFGNNANEAFTLASSVSAAGPYTINVTVPAGATVGSTRMRVMVDYNNSTPNPCRSATFGEAEDYCLSVAAPAPCSGTPTPGNTNATASSACSGGSVTLSLQNATTGTGVTYDWQSADDNAFTVNVSTGLGTSATYAPVITATKYFRCVVTCSGNSGASTPVLISLVSPPVGGTLSPSSFTGCTNSTIAFTLTGSTGNLMWQFATAPGGPFTDMGITATTANINALAMATYYIQVKASNAGCPDAFSNQSTVVINCVGGDNVCSALPVVVGINGPFSCAGATTEAGEPAPPAGTCTTPGVWCNSTVSNSIWFSFVAPASGHVTIQTPGFDTQLAIWSAASCGSILSGGATLKGASDDDANYTAHSGVQFSSYIDAPCLTPGVTYYIQLDPYSSGTTTGTNLVITEITNQAPNAFTGVPSTITQNNDPGQCSAVVTWTAPTAGTDPEGCTVTVTSNYAPGATFPVGTTTVTYTATDQVGASTTASFNVVVVDNELPTVTCNGTVTSYNDAGNCAASITLSDPVVSSDNCAVSYFVGPVGANLYPVGTTMVNWYAVDIHGNSSAVCQQAVTVEVGAPTSPSAVTAPTAAQLNWTSYPGNAGYEVKWQLGAGSFDPNTSGTFVAGAAPPANVTGLVTGNTYHWYVRETCSSGSGNWSAWVDGGTFTTACPAAPSWTLTFSVGTPTIGCPDFTAPLTATLIGAPGFPSPSPTYQWYKNNNPIPGATTANYTAPGKGNYRVEAYSGSCFNITTAPQYVFFTPTVQPYPAWQYICPNNGNVLCYPDLGSSSATSYQWMYSTGGAYSVIPGATTVNYTATTQGQYKCRMTFPGACAPKMSSNAVRLVDYPNLCPPKTDLSIETEDIATLMNNSSLYPNPNTGKFVVEMSKALPADVTVEIFDAMGRLVYTSTMFEGENRKDLDLSNEADGMYMVRLSSEKLTHSFRVQVIR